MGDNLEIFDSEAAVQQAGGDSGLAEELFGMLLNELSDYRNKIATLLEQNGYSTLLETVHKLNGATRYTGVPALSAAANQFELALKGDAKDNYNELCNNLVYEIQRLEEAYPQK